MSEFMKLLGELQRKGKISGLSKVAYQPNILQTNGDREFSKPIVEC